MRLARQLISTKTYAYLIHVVGSLAQDTAGHPAEAQVDIQTISKFIPQNGSALP